MFGSTGVFKMFFQFSQQGPQIRVPASMAAGILPKLASCHGQNQSTFGSRPMLISHPVREKFEEMTVMQYCQERKDEED